MVNYENKVSIKWIVMCFSAEASFIVGGTLLAVGIATARKAIHKKDLPMAFIPLLFSIQQLIEGFLWLILADSSMQTTQHWLATIYGVFVGIIWPLFAPFAIYSMETGHQRRKIIAAMGAAGLVLAGYTLIGLINQPVSVEIINHSLYYKHDIEETQLLIILYLLATCLPFILSSFRHLYIAGGIITFGFLIAFFTFQQTFASVWCFFAAIASSLVYFHFVHRIREPLIAMH